MSLPGARQAVALPHAAFRSNPRTATSGRSTAPGYIRPFGSAAGASTPGCTHVARTTTSDRSTAPGYMRSHDHIRPEHRSGLHALARPALQCAGARQFWTAGHLHLYSRTTPYRRIDIRTEGQYDVNTFTAVKLWIVPRRRFLKMGLPHPRTHREKSAVRSVR
jgi:hypothetical protein